MFDQVSGSSGVSGGVGSWCWGRRSGSAGVGRCGLGSASPARPHLLVTLDVQRVWLWFRLVAGLYFSV